MKAERFIVLSIQKVDPVRPGATKNPRERTSGSKLVGALVVLLVLGTLGVMAFSFLEKQAQDMVESTVKSAVTRAYSVPDDSVSVRVISTPVLPQLIRGNLTDVEIDIASINTTVGSRPFTIQNVTMDIKNVALTSPFKTDSLQVTGVMPLDVLGIQVDAIRPGYTISVSDEGKMMLTGDFQGVVATTEVSFLPGRGPDNNGVDRPAINIQLADTVVDVNGEQVALSSMVDLAQPIQVPVRSIPTAMNIDSVEMADTGLVITLSGTDIELASLR